MTLLHERLSRRFRAAATPPGCQVYCYHGVVHQRQDVRLERNFHVIEDFRQQVQFIRRKPVTALGRFVDALSGHGKSGPLSAAITFDDGYANNLLAAETLAEAKLPWVLFVTTSAVGRQGAIWTVELSLLLLHGDSESVEALEKVWKLKTREDRESAFQAIRYPMKGMPAASRRAALDALRAQFPPAETQRLLERFPSFQMLTWTELRQLAAAGVEIGSHGVDHELHHAAQDPEVRRRELVESKREIEQQLGRPCRFFAFPNGDHCEHSAREVEAAGYELAFTTQPGLVRADCNRFLLPRVSPGGSTTKLKQQLRELQ